MSIKLQTIAGIKWTTVGQVVREATVFAITITLARILSPTEFGLLAMVNVVLGFSNLFSSLGLSNSLVQRKEINQEHLATANAVNYLTGIALFTLVALLSHRIAGFFKEPQLQPLVVFMAISFLLNAPAIVHRNMLFRRMAFSKIALIEVASQVVAGAVAISVAVAGFGVWSLVWQALLSTFLSTTMLFSLSGCRPGLMIQAKAFRDLAGFGSALMGANIVNYWTQNLDKLLIGRFLGGLDLGLYSRAYGLMFLPIKLINRIVSRVMFPAMARIQDDKERVKLAYLEAMNLVCLVVFPIMAGGYVLSEAIVLTLYGAKWAAMVPIVEVLFLYGIFQTISTTTQWIFYSQGRGGLLFAWTIARAIVLATSIGAGILLGNTVAVAFFITVVCGATLAYPEMRIPGSLIGLAFLEIVNSIKFIILAAVLMAGAVEGAQQLVAVWFSPWLVLCVTVPLGAILYFSILAVGGDRTLHGALLIVRRSFR